MNSYSLLAATIISPSSASASPRVATPSRPSDQTTALARRNTISAATTTASVGRSEVGKRPRCYRQWRANQARRSPCWSRSCARPTFPCRRGADILGTSQKNFAAAAGMRPGGEAALTQILGFQQTNEAR